MRKFEHLVRAALVGWARNSDFPSMAVFLILSLCLAAGCQRKTIRDEKPTDQTNQSRQSNQDTQRALDKGDLKLLYQPRKIPKAGSTVASNPQVLNQVVANLNEKIALPWDVTISFQDCDQPDAHYDPETRSIRFVTSLSMSITTYSLTKSKIRRSLTTRFAGLWPRPSFMNWDTDWWMPGNCLLQVRRRMLLISSQR